MNETISDKSSKGGFNPLPFLFLLMALGGLAYAGLGFMGLQEAQIPSGWKRVEGQIVNRGIDVIERQKADGSMTEAYRPSITYRYEIDGAFLLGERLMQHDYTRSLKAVAETEIEDLQVGTKVVVHYNPEDPKDAVLRKSDTIGPMQAISAGLCIGLGCFAIFAISLRRNQTA